MTPSKTTACLFTTLHGGLEGRSFQWKLEGDWWGRGEGRGGGRDQTVAGETHSLFPRHLPSFPYDVIKTQALHAQLTSFPHWPHSWQEAGRGLETRLLLSCRNCKMIVYTSLHGVQYNLHKTKCLILSPPCGYTVLYLDHKHNTSLDSLLKQIMSKVRFSLIRVPLHPISIWPHEY